MLLVGVEIEILRLTAGWMENVLEVAVTVGYCTEVKRILH